MSRSTKHIVGYSALAVVLIATGSMAYGAVAGSGSSARSNSRTVPVEIGSVSQTVSATGNLQPASQANVNFQTSGTITEIDVAVGDQVTAGQMLAKLDPSVAASNLLAATLTLNSANDKLWEVSAGTSTTSQGASNNSGSAGGANGGGGSSAVDQAQLAAASAASQAAATTTTVDPASVDSAQASVVQAQSQVDAAQKALDATTLTAPSDGVVTSITKAVGDQVTAGSSGSGSNTSAAANGSTSSTGNNPTGGGGSNNASGANNSSSSSSTAAFTLITPNSFQVKVGFPESDAVKVQVGQQAMTTLDALPGSSFAGTVQSIDQTATVTSNVVTYNAIVSVTNTPTAAKSGMTANVTVTTMSKDNVLEVPTAAVQTQGESSSVNKLVNGQSVQTDVTTGLQGDSNTEITSGLTAGDQVVIDTGTLATAARNGAGGGGSPTGGGGFGGGGGGFGGGGFGGGGGGFVGRGN